jgi:hypothetical protein
MSEIEITLFTKDGGPLTKRISLTKDERVHSDGGACRMSRGQARRLRLTGLAQFAVAINGLKSNQAVALGALRDGLPDQIGVTTKYKINGDIGPNVIARTARDIVYHGGRAALALFDYDTKGIPDEVRTKLQGLGGFWPALLTAIPGLQGAGRVSRRSTSAGLYRTDSGERLPGSDGEHNFIEVTDGSDIGRALRAAHDRCWLAGFGWLMIGASGQLLERSIVDRMVGTSERLVFEGAPMLVLPLAQDRESRTPRVHDGAIVDTSTGIPPLTIAEAAKLAELKAQQRRALAGEAAKVRSTYIRTRAEQLARRTGTTPQAAAHIIARQCDGVLLPDVPLPFDDEELVGLTVGDVLADPMCFEGTTLADPVEGVEYGHCCARIMIAVDGTPWIHSFAHGRAIYQLRYDTPAIRKLLEQAQDADVLDSLIRLDAQAEISEVELDELIRYLKQRTGNSIPSMKRTVREAREQRAAVRAQEQRDRRLAERSDPRPQLSCPAYDAPWLPVMETILEVVRSVSPTQQIKRDIEQVAMQPRRIVVPRTHAFSREEDEH